MLFNRRRKLRKHQQLCLWLQREKSLFPTEPSRCKGLLTRRKQQLESERAKCARQDKRWQQICTDMEFCTGFPSLSGRHSELPPPFFPIQVLVCCCARLISSSSSILFSPPSIFRCCLSHKHTLSLSLSRPSRDVSTALTSLSLLGVLAVCPARSLALFLSLPPSVSPAASHFPLLCASFLLLPSRSLHRSISLFKRK